MSHPGEYYSNYPGAVEIPLLQKHLVLTGPPGTAPGSVGAALCSLTGWPMCEVERLVEHDAGRAIAALVQTEGIQMVSARVWSHVARQLARPRPSVIAVHAPFLQHAPRLAHVRAHAQLVFLDAHPAGLPAALRRRQQEQPGELPWFGRFPIDDARVAELHAASQTVAAGASLRHPVDGADRPLRTVQALLETLRG